MWGEGRRDLLCHALEELAAPGKYSHAKARCWLSHFAWPRPSVRSLCLLQEPRLLSHPSQGRPWGRGWGNGSRGTCIDPSSRSHGCCVCKLLQVALWAQLFPTLSSELPGTPAHPFSASSTTAGSWSLMAVPAPPGETPKGQPIRVRVQIFQKALKAQRG